MVAVRESVQHGLVFDTDRRTRESHIYVCFRSPAAKVGEDPKLQTSRPKLERNDSQATPLLSVIGESHKGDFALKSPSPPIATLLPGGTARTASSRSPK